MEHPTQPDAPDEVRLEPPTTLGGDPFEERRGASWRATLIGVLLALAVLNVAWLIAGERIASQLVADSAAAEDGGIVWTCPMHPTVESNKAGTCPVCAMDLVPLIGEGAEMSPEARHAIEQVAASPTQRVVGDYATVEVRSIRAHGHAHADEPAAEPGGVEVVGRILAPEDARATVTSWIPGRVDKLHVEETGKVVDKGDALARLYSEALSSAQADYLAAQGGDEFARVYAEAAERKLRLYGMSTRQIERLVERGKVSPHITIYATEGGTITERLVHEGQYVAEGAALFSVTDLSRVWVELDVPQADLSRVELGQTIEVRLDNAPALGEVTGVVDFISPIARAETQTVPVRLVVDNPDGKLAPRMLARAVLHPTTPESPSPQAPPEAQAPGRVHLVPRTAVIETGARTMVWVEVARHAFEPRLVTTSGRLGQDVTIVAGLSDGERVVEHAGFLLDPESPLPSPDDARMRSALDDVEAAERLHLLRHVGVGEFFCPMHPEVHAQSAGRCPKCNMDLVEMTAELHTRVAATDPIASLAPGTWYCPMGAEHIADAPGRCPICNMHLVQKQADDGATLVDDPIDTVPTGQWYCPMDAEWVQDGPGDCPICKMALVEKTPEATP